MKIITMLPWADWLALLIGLQWICMGLMPCVRSWLTAASSSNTVRSVWFMLL